MVKKHELCSVLILTYVRKGNLNLSFYFGLIKEIKKFNTFLLMLKSIYNPRHWRCDCYVLDLMEEEITGGLWVYNLIL